MKRVLVDTGPLVAILSRADERHEVCVEALRHLPAPLLTCWPVVTEVSWLLRAYPEVLRKFLDTLDHGLFEVLPLAGAGAEAIAGIMRHFADVRPQLADAALVYLADREAIDTIFTLDRRDFAVYRTHKGRPFRLIPRLD